VGGGWALEIECIKERCGTYNYNLWPFVALINLTIANNSSVHDKLTHVPLQAKLTDLSRVSVSSPVVDIGIFYHL
jgi:hypothetical protein